MKFSLKKLAFSLLSAIGVTAASLGAAGCVAKASAAAAPDNIEISFLPPPDDGSLPTAHSGNENLAYINYVFANQPQYHSYSYGVTSASIATQTTRTFRDYKDGVLVTTDLTFSSMVKSSTQTCTIIGDGETESQVYFRTGAAPVSNEVAATDIEWSGEAPSYFSVRSYNYTYGLLPNELFNYIINDNTLISCEQVKVTSEGNYELSFSLDPVASTYYYQYGMKTRGGLADYPEFVSVAFTVTFDNNWQILKSKMNEHARVNKGIIVDSYSEFYCDYYYGGSKFDGAHYAYYEDYYKQYVGDESLTSGAGGDEDAPLDIAGALSNGFAKVLNGGEQFAVTARLGRNVYSGFIWLSLDLDNLTVDPVGSIALKLSLGRNFEDQSLYAEFSDGNLNVYYGPDFALNANLAEVKLQAEQFENLINRIASVFKKDASAPYAVALSEEEEGDPLTDLLNAMTIEETGSQAVVSLVTDDLLGLGIGIDVNLTLGINGKKIAFRSASVGGLSVKGKPVDLNLLLRTTTEPLIKREERNGANLADYMADVHALLDSKLLRVDLGLHGGDEQVKISALKNVDAEVTAYVDLSGVTVGAEAYVRYNGLSASAEIIYDYSKGAGKYGTAAIYLKELCGNQTNLKLSCNIEDLVEAIGSLVTTAGADFSVDTDNLIGLLGSALNVNFTPLISDMYADGSRILIAVDVDTVLSMLGVDAGVKFGGCTLVYDKGEGAGSNGGKLSASLPAIGFGLNVSGERGQISSFDKTDCLDISYVLEDVDKVLNSQNYKISLTLDGSGKGVQVEQLAGLQGSVNAYLTLGDILVGADARVSYNYKGAQISAALSAYYDNSAKTAMLALTELMGAPVSLKLRCNIEELADGIEQLLTLAGKSLNLSLDIGGGADLAGVLTDLLSADLANVLPALESTNGGLRLGVNIDEALKLFNLDIGIKLGTVTLAYDHNGSPLLSASLPALGLDVAFDCTEEEVQMPSSEDYLDLCYVIDDVLSLINDDGLIKLNLSLNGGAQGVTLTQLNGVAADLTAYLDTEGKSVKAEASVSYTSSREEDGRTVEDVISAKLEVWYSFEGASLDNGLYGTAALCLKELNGVDTDVKLYCDIGEVKSGIEALIKRAAVEENPVSEEGKQQAQQSSDVLADVLSKLTGTKLSEILIQLTTSGEGLTVQLDADKLLQLLGVETGISFGRVKLAYRHGQGSLLLGELPAFGASLTLGTAEEDIGKMPAKADCLDINDILAVVNGVWDEVDAIINGKAISFEVKQSSTYLALDGLVIGFGGNGEISWAKGGEYVALDLAMSITENEAEICGNTDTAFVKLIYDKNAEESPLIRLAVNEVAIDIYKEDIDGVIEGFNGIYNKVKGLLGISSENEGEEEGQEGAAERIANAKGATSNDKLITLIFKVLSTDGWVKFLNDLTLTADGKSVALSYLSDNAANVVISADGGIKLHYDGAFGKEEDRMVSVGGKRFALSGDISVSASAGSITRGLTEFFDIYSKNSGGDTVKFIRNAYDFLFEAISSFNVNDVLGSDTYAVTFTLNGNNCNVAALKDVFIDAEIYVTGEDGGHGKLAEGFLNVNAAGVVIKLNVITQRVGSDTKFYVNLSQVMDVILPDLKFLATQESLYRTIDALIGAVNDTNVIDFVTKLLGSDGAVKEEKEEKKEAEKKDAVLSEEQRAGVASLIEGLINFNFSEAFIATAANGQFENDGVLDAQISLDNIFTQLGLKNDGGSLGSLRVQINHNDHSMSTYGEAVITTSEGVQQTEQWISLSSARTQRRDYSKYNPEDYISVEFLPDLLNDLVNFATGEKQDAEGNVVKEVYDSFTLSGSINASINLVVTTLKANIDISTLTVSIGEDGFWFSGVLHINKISALSIVTIPESTVGITYANGYITLVKGLTSGSPEYKIMTLEYFLDHMLVKNGSVLEWWLNVSGWSTLISVINTAAGDLNISSGLTNPEDIYLYKESSAGEEYEISMYDFVDSLRVMIDGRQTACFGDYTGFENQLGVHDNYYGFALNGGKISGGVLNKLYAAVTRNASTGISGVKAYASIDAGSLKEMVKLSVNLSYEEGLTAADDYKLGTSLASSGVRAPNLYAKAVEAAGGEQNIDFAHNVKKAAQGYDEIFGCYSTADNSYDYSHMLYTHQLTVVGLDGVKTVREVRHGSTVHLYDNNSPIYTDSTKKDRVIYSTDGKDVLTTELVVEGDVTVCAVTRPAVTAIIVSGSNEYEVSTFAGGRVPTSVKGLETIGSMYYDEAMTNPVGANDLVEGGSVIRLYGVLVQSELTVNYVNYKFTYDENSPAKGYYTAVGRGAGFNDYYCTNGNALVIENEINGYPVVAIAAEAFANTEGHSIVSVVLPANVTFVGEKAFADNVGMQSATFLASEVTVGGSSGEKEEDNTTPFYGCSAEAGGTTTNLVIYYNSVKFEGSASNFYWTKFRRDGSGAIYHRYYIGVDPNGTKLVGDYDHASGGALHAAGKWQFVNAEYALDISGVPSTMLNEASVERFISEYYPMSVTSDFVGSPKAAEIEQALGVYLSQFDMTACGVSYKCSYTAAYNKSGSVVTVSYAIGFTQAASITVLSNYDCVYYGVSIAANVPTQISIPVEDLENPATPTDGTYILNSMQVTEQADGTKLCSLNWREKYTYTVSFTFKGNLVTTITMNLKDGTSSSKKASGFSSPTFSFTVKEGQRVTATGNDGKTMTLYIDGVEAGTFTTSSYSFKSDCSFDKEVYSNSSYTFKF